jgi:hypothetical protein
LPQPNPSEPQVASCLEEVLRFLEAETVDDLAAAFDEYCEDGTAYVDLMWEPECLTVCFRTRGIGLDYPFDVREIWATLDELQDEFRAEDELEASVNQFSPYVGEHLNFYVYLLRDPRDEQIFYVGKGRDNRVFAHAKDALDETQSSDKLDRIRAIREAGLEVEYELLRFGLSSKEAFEVESAAIQLLGLHDLLNIVAGHHGAERGRMSVEDATSLYEAPPAPDIDVPAMLIKIPKLWYPAMPASALYDATSGWWALGSRCQNAKYVFSVNRGVIREVYEVDSWRQRIEGERDWQDDIGKKARWGFEGRVAEDLARYRGTSVKHLFKRGEASPTKYVNC